ENDNPALDGVFAYRRENSMHVVIGTNADLARAMYVTGDFFRTLRLTPAAGRLFSKEDDVPNAPAVAVISHRFWEKHLGSTQDVAGRPITINNQPLTISGVAPEEFFGLAPGETADLLIPMHLSDRLAESTSPMSQPGKYANGTYFWAEIM